MQLSVILITRNEAAQIQACLESVAFADEWIVVDHGSTDETVAIARAFGAQVISTVDWPGFGPQKNRALALAQGDWVLSLDADERVTPALAEQIQTAIQKRSHLAYDIPRLTQFCGCWIRHCGWTPDRVLRLFQRGHARFSDDQIHERVVVNAGEAGHLKACLLHYSYPTPAHYWDKLGRYSLAWAQQQYARGKMSSMPRAVLSGIVAFLRSYVFRLGVLDGAMGFAVCAMQAQAAFGKHFSLYCLGRSKK